MTRWNDTGDVQRGSDYDDRWRQMAAAGDSIHGEADLICTFEPSSVLDAGCGTGRVAIELATRGIDVVGIDLDGSMLAVARHKAPGLRWVSGDLAAVTIGDADGPRRFDVVALPGNVMIFLTPGTEGAVVANLARHLEPSGRLVAGFELMPDRLMLADYDRAAEAAGLELESRWATWDREPFAGGDYAVTVHRHAGSS